jgi:outer membrane lipoprotein-sorting protein
MVQRFSRFMVAMLALGLMAAPALAQRISLGELSGYLNGLGVVEAEFTQINSDGSISLGTLRISRPGKVRFEYAPPDRALVVSDGNQVAIFDGKSNIPPERYPMRRTPLNLILAPQVNLSQDRMVTRHVEDAGTTRVRAQDPQHPEYGHIELVFTANPTELRQWVITDNTGGQTTVILGEMRKGARLNSDLFSIEAELRIRGIELDR